MDKAKEYRTKIKTIPFLFLETKKVSNLICQGFEAIEIKERAVNENIFQVKTEKRKKEMVSTILDRLKHLDKYLIQIIASGDFETSKLLVLYSIIKTDRLFYEFMYEVFREKFILKEKYLTEKDFSLFFDSKKQQSEKVVSWNDYTFYKLKQVYIRILFEAGLLNNQKGNREIKRGYIDYEVKEHIRGIGDKIFLEIVAGE